MLPPLDDLWKMCSPGMAAADGVYATLREAILSGRLAPGEHLAEQLLGRQLEVSRTPVREALHRLETEQLAVRIPRGGMVVRSVTESELLEIYTVRTMLDGLAARLAASQALPADLAHLRWVNRELDAAAQRSNPQAMAELNVRFHESLCQAGYNGLLLQFVCQIHDRVRRFGGTTFAYPRRAAAAVTEHALLLDAIEKHDGDTAERLAREHMTQARKVRIAMLREASARPD